MHLIEHVHALGLAAAAARGAFRPAAADVITSEGRSHWLI